MGFINAGRRRRGRWAFFGRPVTGLLVTSGICFNIRKKPLSFIVTAAFVKPNFIFDVLLYIMLATSSAKLSSRF